MDPKPTFTEWLMAGISMGFCGKPFCATHDGPPLDEIEEADFAEGYDPCIQAFRVYPDSSGPDKDLEPGG